MKTVKSHFNLNCNYKRNITKINGLTSFKNNVRCELTTGNNYNTVVNYNVDFEEMKVHILIQMEYIIFVQKVEIMFYAIIKKDI